MKRLLFFICTLLCANVLLAQTRFIVGELQYEVTGTNKVEVHDCMPSATSIVIPNTVTYQGTNYSVTKIGNDAFEDCSSLTSVTIPNSVTSIGNYAFYNCSSLTSVTIPNSVISIGNYAFRNCSSLTYVTIGNSVTSIGSHAFYNCSSLTSVTIPNSVTSIGWDAFRNCDGLTSVDIPNSVTSIGGRAFENCDGLTSITIPNSVTSIGSSAFAYCRSLTSVTLPQNATIENSAFYDAGTKITIDSITYSKTTASLMVGFNNFSNVGFTSFYLGDNVYRNPATDMYVDDCDTNKSGYLIIPSAIEINDIEYPVTSISWGAFMDCYSLTSVTIPNSVTTIEGWAFHYCSSLTSVTIGNSVTSIGEYTFERCSSLTSVTCLAETAPTLEGLSSFVFAYTPSTKTLTVPCESDYSAWESATTWASVERIGCEEEECVDVFTIGDLTYEKTSATEVSVKDCDSTATEVIIPASVEQCGITYSVTSIGDSAFRGCFDLTSVNIPNIVTSIGDYAFSSCFDLTSVNIPNIVTSIGRNAFAGSGLTSINIPNGITTIDTATFYDCDDLTSINIPNSVTSICYDAFCFCNGLESVTIPNSVTSIGGYAFYCCNSLDSVTIPNSVISIGYRAFQSCSSLTSVTIPNSVTSIGIQAFSDCSSLTSVNIPNSVTSIGYGTFEDCSSLTSVICLAETAPSLGNNVFSSTPSTKTLTVPCESDYSAWESATTWASVERIGCEEEECVDVFTIGDLTYEKTSATEVSVKDCNSTATEVIIPASIEQCGITYSVTSIGEDAFNYCYSLTSVTIPNSVTSIGGYAFYDCSSLTSVTIPNSVTSIGDATFWKCSSLTSIDIPDSVTTIGRWAFYYCSSLTSVTIPNSVTSIGNWAFSDCSSLTSVTIPNSVTSIGGYAFYGCSSLTSVNIPNSVTYIEDATFFDCISLTSITIPDSVTTIGRWALSGCSSLTSIDIPNSVTSIDLMSFANCRSLTSVTIPNSVTSIGDYAFMGCDSLTSVTIGNSVDTIGDSAFYWCSSLTSVTCLAETAPSLGVDVFYNTPSNATLTVPFNASGYTSDWGNATWQKIYHKINEGEIKTLTNAFEITEDNKRGVINEGVLRITQSGQLINQTETNVGGIIEIETPTLANDKWSFIGAPFNNYKLEVVKPGTKDISISLFDYTTGNWAEDFATIDDSVGSGEGFFAWSFAAEPTVFTTYGDGAETYNFETIPAYSLNNGAVNVTKNLTTNAEGGNWLALSNPYTFKLDVEKFLSEHGDIKGGEVYRFNGSVWTPVSEGEINMTEGFFVNFENPGTHSVSFSKFYIYEPAKSKAIEAKDYITLNVAEGENVSKLRFAQNPKAKQGDDIFDANKLFSPLEITEPYFVTDGVALVKEEVKEYPYTATLNIRNYETKEVTLSIDNIPEGVNVYLIDNGFEVKMNGGVEYNTRIIKGENADRFKVLFKKQHRLEKINDNQITITNNNRQISVKSDKTDLNIEVYNQLGQKVFSTNEYNFTLSEQPAGSYVIKAYQGRFSESKKIVIE